MDVEIRCGKLPARMAAKSCLVRPSAAATEIVVARNSLAVPARWASRARMRRRNVDVSQAHATRASCRLRFQNIISFGDVALVSPKNNAKSKPSPSRSRLPPRAPGKYLQPAFWPVFPPPVSTINAAHESAAAASRKRRSRSLACRSEPARSTGRECPPSEPLCSYGAATPPSNRCALPTSSLARGSNISTSVDAFHAESRIRVPGSQPAQSSARPLRWFPCVAPNKSRRAGRLAASTPSFPRCGLALTALRFFRCCAPARTLSSPTARRTPPFRSVSPAQQPPKCSQCGLEPSYPTTR